MILGKREVNDTKSPQSRRGETGHAVLVPYAVSIFKASWRERKTGTEIPVLGDNFTLPGVSSEPELPNSPPQVGIRVF
jgi:hypothetical protein